MDVSELKVPRPESSNGSWVIQKLVINKNMATSYNFQSLRDGSDRMITYGTYTILRKRKKIIATDTPVEVEQYLDFLNNCSGSIIINGLKLGVLLKALIDNEKVTRITVVETDVDVLNLIEPLIYEYRKNRPLLVIEFYRPDNYLQFNPKTSFDFVFHDVINFVSIGNLELVEQLINKYKNISKQQGAWGYKDGLTYRKKLAGEGL